MLAQTSSPALAQQQFTLKFSTQTVNDVQTKYMEIYKEELEKEAKGRIKVELYPAGQLGRQLEGLRLGTIQAAIGPAELMVGADERLQAVAFPGLFKNDEHARRTIQEPEFRKPLVEVVASRNLLLVGITTYAPQAFAFKAPVKELRDIAGKRVRVLASEAEQAQISALGASGTPIPLPEVLSALQQGPIDGVNSGMPVFVAFKYYDTAPNVLDTHLWELVSIAMVSKRSYDTLPSDLQKMVVDVGQRIEPKVAAWSKERNAELAATWTKNGGKIYQLPPDQQAKAEQEAEAAIQPLVQKDKPLDEFYQKLKAAAKKAM
jgi:TRAP-type C4-dicarboxylate transport system substrate-binding protein